VWRNLWKPTRREDRSGGGIPKKKSKSFIPGVREVVLRLTRRRGGLKKEEEESNQMPRTGSCRGARVDYAECGKSNYSDMAVGKRTGLQGRSTEGGGKKSSTGEGRGKGSKVEGLGGRAEERKFISL